LDRAPLYVNVGESLANPRSCRLALGRNGQNRCKRTRCLLPTTVDARATAALADEFCAHFEPCIAKVKLEAFNYSTSRRRVTAHARPRGHPRLSITWQYLATIRPSRSPSQNERVYPTQRRKSREIPVRGTQRKPVLQRQRGQMRVRHEIGMHTGEREEFI